MRESIFISEIVASLKMQGAWAYKIPDSPTSWTSHATRFTPEKPCDIVSMYRGPGMLIECKQIKKYQAFGKTQMQDSQIENLDDTIEKGNRGFVFLNIRIKAIKGEQKHENRLMIFDWREWGQVFKSGTIKMNELKRLSELHAIDGHSVLKPGSKKDYVIRYDLKSFLEKLRR